MPPESLDGPTLDAPDCDADYDPLGDTDAKPLLRAVFHAALAFGSLTFIMARR